MALLWLESSKLDYFSLNKTRITEKQPSFPDSEIHLMTWLEIAMFDSRI